MRRRDGPPAPQRAAAGRHCLGPGKKREPGAASLWRSHLCSDRWLGSSASVKLVSCSVGLMPRAGPDHVTNAAK